MLNNSQIFRELTRKIFVKFRDTRQSPSRCGGFVAGFSRSRAVRNRIAHASSLFRRKRKYAQMWGAGAGKPCLREDL